jgi:hypothetical protein
MRSRVIALLILDIGARRRWVEHHAPAAKTILILSSNISLGDIRFTLVYL